MQNVANKPWIAPVAPLRPAQIAQCLAHAREALVARRVQVAREDHALVVGNERQIARRPTTGEELDDILEAAQPGATVTLARLPIERSYWSVGEDLDNHVRRDLVTRDYELSRIELAPRPAR